MEVGVLSYSSFLFSLVHSTYKCMFTNRLTKEGTNKYKYKHAVLILSPFLKIRLNSSFTFPNKPSQLLQITVQWHVEEGGIFYSQWDTVQHLNALNFICVNSAHPKHDTGN